MNHPRGPPEIILLCPSRWGRDRVSSLAPYSMLVFDMVTCGREERPQNHHRSSAGAPRKSPESDRCRRHPDRSYRPPTGRRSGELCPPPAASWQGPVQPDCHGAQGGPVIAVDTSTWIAYLQADSGTDASLLDQALLDRQVL